MEKVGLVAGAAVVIFLFLALGPLLVIWSLNTLFPVLAIGYTFWNWLAVFFLMLAFGNKGVQRVKGME